MEKDVAENWATLMITPVYHYAFRNVLMNAIYTNIPIKIFTYSIRVPMFSCIEFYVGALVKTYKTHIYIMCN